jgi:hypothetical protein
MTRGTGRGRPPRRGSGQRDGAGRLDLPEQHNGQFNGVHAGVRAGGNCRRRGAELLLHGLIGRATLDIDARYGSTSVVDSITAQMAKEYGLPVQWLISDAAAFLPGNVLWMAGLPESSSPFRLADLPSGYYRTWSWTVSTYTSSAVGS